MRLKYAAYILLAASFEIAGCTDDQEEWVDDDAPLTVAITASWQNGRENGETRSLPDFITANVLTTPTPEWICIDLPASLGGSFYAKTTSKQDVQGYIPFHEFYRAGVKLDKCPITRNMAGTTDITAYYMLKNGEAVDPASFTPFQLSDIPVIGPTDYLSSDVVRYTAETTPRDHLLFTMYHRTALLRLKFAVDQKYLKVRDIVLRKIKINNHNVDFIDYSILDDSDGNKLTETPSFIAFAYIKPDATDFSLSKPWTFECTYDIYDKDEISATHLTRKDVTAKNQVKMNNLLSPAVKLEPGKYYDLNITINPDYLYVLSEHDNKHITIN